MTDEISIAGGWLGTYQYSGFGPLARVRFEATFRTVGIPATQIDGEIVDDGALGTALIAGSQSGMTVRFSKQYRVSPSAQHTRRVEYAGVMSDDGMVLRGTWQLHGWSHGALLPGAHGSWYARRRWIEAADESERVDDAEAAPAEIGR